jgi:drug/metabolite transporter (DMT)-like permease
MISFLWIPATLFASVFQVARNAFQRGMMSQTGPWGATLVRFLFGLPFSVLFSVTAILATPAARPSFGPAFWVSAVSGAAGQVLATASLLVAMNRAGFAVGTAVQQSSLPLAAIVGLIAFHDHLSPIAWLGVAVTTAGLAALTWPRHATGPKPASGAVFGLLSGLCFGFSLNAFRHVGLAFEPHHHLYAAVVSVAVVQAIQSLALTTILAVRDPAALRAVAKGWRESLAAGFCGAVASSCWFLALGLAPAAPVRAVGVVEAPIAAFAGRRLFAERLQVQQILAGVAVLGGVLLTALS